jgi:hypothetical protein
LVPDQVFSMIGTNAHDYEVAHGLSRSLVGPKATVVQTCHAFVRDSPALTSIAAIAAAPAWLTLKRATRTCASSPEW